MKVKTVRTVVVVAVFAVLAVGLAFNFGTGTLSAFGWRDLSLLCPLGALTSMIAGKTLIPRAVIALVLVVAVVLLVGRAFCSWICPVPLIQRLRHAFSPRRREGEGFGADGNAAPEGADGNAAGSLAVAAETPAMAAAEAPATAAAAAATSAAKKPRSRCGTAKGCAACHKRLDRVDSRHMVLGGALLSAAVFGFPVFCLVCPVGLAFGTVLLLIGLFGHGDVTWSVLLVPALLLAEVVFFRQWCSKICPMGAFLSLVSKGNRTLRPVIDQGKCLETTQQAHCGRCTMACEEGINLRDGSLGASASECTRCLACVEACPAQAIKVVPLVRGRRREKAPVGQTEPLAGDELDVAIIEREG